MIRMLRDLPDAAIAIEFLEILMKYLAVTDNPVQPEDTLKAVENCF